MKDNIRRCRNWHEQGRDLVVAGQAKGKWQLQGQGGGYSQGCPWCSEPSRDSEGSKASPGLLTGRGLGHSTGEGRLRASFVCLAWGREPRWELGGCGCCPLLLQGDCREDGPRLSS